MKSDIQGEKKGKIRTFFITLIFEIGRALVLLVREQHKYHMSDLQPFVYISRIFFTQYLKWFRSLPLDKQTPTKLRVCFLCLIRDIESNRQFHKRILKMLLKMRKCRYMCI